MMILIEADTANAKKLQSPIITVQTLRHITAFQFYIRSYIMSGYNLQTLKITTMHHYCVIPNVLKDGNIMRPETLIYSCNF